MSVWVAKPTMISTQTSHAQLGTARNNTDSTQDLFGGTGRILEFVSSVVVLYRIAVVVEDFRLLARVASQEFASEPHQNFI